MSFNKYYQSEIARYGGSQKYVLAKTREKRALIERVIKYSRGSKLLEAGSGSSSNSIYLANEGYEVTAIDNDPKMISLAKELSKPFKAKPKFLRKEITHFEGKYSVVFSHGVLEHFEDKKIIELINKEIVLGDFVIFSVPSDFFTKEQAINGDERFISVKKWRSLISQTNGKIVEEFSYFYDSDNLKLRILKLVFNLTRGIFPTKKPYIGFILKKNVCSP
ncbi:class I SAM-dependent methyltransferase [Candidatus Pacearchaeota archaeon]|nr:class I SAM-dependent methyltransferase [Candidatus Pacearchaeota archaeon]